MSNIQNNKFESRLTSELQTSLKHVKTLFGIVNDENVTFCIDTSGSMHQFYDYIREHLIEVLVKLSSDKRHKFNVVLFNSSVYQFAKNPVQCSLENIHLLIQWLQNGKIYESKSDLLGGLIKSFETNPDSVYLVSDGYPNQDRKVILSNLLHICRGHPIQCILITDTVPVDEYSIEIMEGIAQISHGSFTIIQHTKHGNVDVIQPLFQALVPNTHIRRLYTNSYQTKKKNKEVTSDLNGIDYGICLKNDPMLDPPLAVPFKIRDPISGSSCPFYHPYYHWYWPQYWQNKGPGPFCMWSNCDEQYQCMSQQFRKSRAFIGARGQSSQFYESACNFPNSFTLMMNRVILSVSEKHHGKLLKGVILGQSRSDQFKVQFDCDREFNEISSVKISDALDLDEIERHRIDCGNWVVVPMVVCPEEVKDTEVLSGEYAIARVVEGKELRAESSNALDIPSTELTIHLLGSDNQFSIPTNKAAVISDSLKQRLEKKSEFIRTRPQSSIDDNISKENDNDNDNDKQEKDDIDDMKKNTDDKSTVSCNCNKSLKHSETLYHCCCFKHCTSSMSHHDHHPTVNATPIEPVTKEDEGISLEELERRIEELKNRTNDEISMENENNNNEDFDEDENDFMKSDDKSDEEEWVTKLRDNNSSNLDMLSSSTYELPQNNLTTHKSQYTETDLNWALLRIMNKQENDRLQARKRARQNPPWRYWANDKIPDVIDPPSTEPYKDPEHFGCIMPKQPSNVTQKPALFEWPNIKMKRIEAHSTDDSVSPDRIFKMIRQSAPIYHYTMNQEHKSPFQPSNFYLNKYNSTNQNPVGYPIKSRYSSNNALNHHSNSIKLGPYTDLARPRCGSRSLERTRIEAQIMRDEENLKNYARQKLTCPSKSVTIVQT